MANHELNGTILMRYFLTFCIFSFSLFLQGQTSSSDNSSVLIRFHPAIDGADFLTANRFRSNKLPGWKIRRKISNLLNIYSIEVLGDYAAADRLIRTLRQHNDQILEIGFDTPLKYRNSTPDDEFFQEQWNLEKIQLPQVWIETTGGTTASGDDVVIAVLEKGIELNHPEILDNIWRNEREIPDNGIDDDANGYVDDYFGLNLDVLTDEHPVLSHGTQVCGIIGAKTDNADGMAGINWNTKILFLSGVDLVSEVIEAYEYLYNLRKKYNESNGEEGALIVVNNNSFGWDNLRPEELRMGTELCQMYDLMGSVGILSVGAGPNNDVNVEIAGDTPTNCASDFFIGVTSTDEADEKSRDGGFGELSIDIGAPGERIRATDKGGGYGVYSGTSFAAPHVTGAIGLMYALPCGQIGDDARLNAGQTALFIKNILLLGTDPVTSLEGRTVSGGRLNVFNAMTNLQVYCGAREGEKLDILNVFPNPASSVLKITYETTDFEPYQLILSNSLGQILYERTFTPPRFADSILQEDLSWLSPGVYTASIVKRNNIVSRRFIIDRF